jgi:hypothetical protein
LRISKYSAGSTRPPESPTVAMVSPAVTRLADLLVEPLVVAVEAQVPVTVIDDGQQPRPDSQSA